MGFDDVNTNGQQMDYSIYNPTGSGKTLYIYQMLCEGGPDVDESTPFASVDGQMTVVSQS